MARILLVDDDSATVRVLTRVLHREWPLSADELQVDVAQTVAEAKRLLAEFTYDVVILDFKLPAHSLGDFTAVDETLCLEVMRKLPHALVGHITSNPEDRQVKAHLNAMHLERTGMNAFSLSKSETDYPQRLMANVKQHLFAKPIERQLEQLFGAATPEMQAQESIFCMTHELANLSHEIKLHWQDLEEPLKVRIRAAFKYVETDAAGHLVNLRLF